MTCLEKLEILWSDLIENLTDNKKHCNKMNLLINSCQNDSILLHNAISQHAYNYIRQSIDGDSIIFKDLIATDAINFLRPLIISQLQDLNPIEKQLINSYRQLHLKQVIKEINFNSIESNIGGSGNLLFSRNYLTFINIYRAERLNKLFELVTSLIPIPNPLVTLTAGLNLSFDLYKKVNQKEYFNEDALREWLRRIPRENSLSIKICDIESVMVQSYNDFTSIIFHVDNNENYALVNFYNYNFNDLKGFIFFSLMNLGVLNGRLFYPIGNNALASQNLLNGKVHIPEINDFQSNESAHAIADLHIDSKKSTGELYFEINESIKEQKKSLLGSESAVMRIENNLKELSVRLSTLEELIQSYCKIFGSNLLHDLRNSSSNYTTLNRLLDPFIKARLVETNNSYEILLKISDCQIDEEYKIETIGNFVNQHEEIDNDFDETQYIFNEIDSIRSLFKPYKELENYFNKNLISRVVCEKVIEEYYNRFFLDLLYEIANCSNSYIKIEKLLFQFIKHGLIEKAYIRQPKVKSFEDIKYVVIK